MIIFIKIINIFIIFIFQIMKTNDCISLMNKIKTNNFKKTQSTKNNLSSKLSKSNIYYNKKSNPNHYSYIKTNFTLIAEKSKKKNFSKSRCHTDYNKSKSKIKNNQKQKQNQNQI